MSQTIKKLVGIVDHVVKSENQKLILVENLIQQNETTNILRKRMKSNTMKDY